MKRGVTLVPLDQATYPACSNCEFEMSLNHTPFIALNAGPNGRQRL